MTDTKDPLLTAALLAQTGEPVGPPPNDKELRAWADRTLGERRREEVESHIAHSPATCERAATFLGQDAKTTNDRWEGTRYHGLISPPWLVAASIVCIALAMFDYFRAPPSRAPDNVPRIERAATPAISDWRLAAFMSGFLSADETELAGMTNTGMPPAGCLDGDQCAQLPGLLRELGAALRQYGLDCRASRVVGTATRADLERLATRLSTSLELAPWSQVTNNLLRVLQQQPRNACEELRQLEARSFAPRRAD